MPAAIGFAREHGLEVSIRGAGHNIAGNALCDGGLLIDHSKMKGVTVDTNTKRADVEPGATLGDFDAAVQAHGLATPVGINSTTGIAGLTLGGGFGWLTRKYGMTIDALVSVDMVTADGKQLHASQSEHRPVLGYSRRGRKLWCRYAVRVSTLPGRAEVTAGLIVFPAAQSKQLLVNYRDYIESTPEEFNTWVNHATGSPAAVSSGNRARDGRPRARALSRRSSGRGREAYRTAPDVGRPGG